jgi:hypothetical protein
MELEEVNKKIMFEPTSLPILRESIIVSGTKIGEVWPFENGGYQCQLHFGPLSENYNNLYLGGFGDTKIKAIYASIENGRKQELCIKRALSFLTEFIGDYNES